MLSSLYGPALIQVFVSVLKDMSYPIGKDSSSCDEEDFIRVELLNMGW